MVSLVGVMALLGARNRYRYVPAAQEYAGRPVPRTLFPLPRFIRIGGTLAAVLHFLRSLRWEMTLLIAVLALAAALSQQTPAIHASVREMKKNKNQIFWFSSLKNPGMDFSEFPIIIFVGRATRSNALPARACRSANAADSRCWR